jgi:hypothetical protein
MDDDIEFDELSGEEDIDNIWYVLFTCKKSLDSPRPGHVIVEVLDPFYDRHDPR